MTRAARRRAERAANKVESEQTIILANPVSHQFGTFIFGNSLRVPGPEAVVQGGDGIGKTVLIAAAGPSLNDHIAEYAGSTTELWACNSALPWLVDQGYPVTHGITVDQTPAMLNEWEAAPDVEYLLCSTVHPHLTEHLLDKHSRRVRWFHNYVGIRQPPVEYCQCGHDLKPFHARGRCTECADCTSYRPYRMSYEDWLYSTLYPPTIRVGAGLNTATRAIDLALTMGYERVTVLGADCAMRVPGPMPRCAPGSPEHKAWLRSTILHADGGDALASGATATTIGGEIDGRWWETKPDMMISAVFLLRMQDAVGNDRLRLVGDTLPNALRVAKTLRKHTNGELVEVHGVEDVIAWMPAMMDGNGKPLIPRADSETVALWRDKSLG